MGVSRRAELPAGESSFIKAPVGSSSEHSTWCVTSNQERDNESLIRREQPRLPRFRKKISGPQVRCFK